MLAPACTREKASHICMQMKTSVRARYTGVHSGGGRPVCTGAFEQRWHAGKERPARMCSVVIPFIVNAVSSALSTPHAYVALLPNHAPLVYLVPGPEAELLLRFSLPPVSFLPLTTSAARMHSCAVHARVRRRRARLGGACRLVSVPGARADVCPYFAHFTCTKQRAAAAAELSCRPCFLMTDSSQSPFQGRFRPGRGHRGRRQRFLFNGELGQINERIACRLASAGLASV